MQPPSAAVSCFSSRIEVRGFGNKWFVGQFAGIDVIAGEVRVTFPDNIEQPRIVPISAVRFIPKRSSGLSPFKPSSGDRVEVWSDGGDACPPFWSPGVVIGTRDGVYIVKLEEANEEGTDDDEPRPAEETLFQASQIRPPTCLPLEVGREDEGSGGYFEGGDEKEEALDRNGDVGELSSSSRDNTAPLLSKLKSKVIDLPLSLSEWLISEDGKGCMRHIAASARLISVDSAKSNKTPRAAPPKKQIASTKGSEKHSKPAAAPPRPLTNDHSSSSSVSLRSKQPEPAEGKIIIKFPTTRRLVGLTIGKVGANIRSVQEELDVHVRVLEVCNDSPTGSMVIIEGTCEDDVALARRRLEFFITKYPIPEESVQWVVGPRFSNLAALSEQTGLHYARYADLDDAGQKQPCIEMCGRVDEIEKAKTLIESHLHYREVFRDVKAKRISLINAINAQSISSSSGKPPTSLSIGVEKFGSKESISSETPAASTIDSMDRSSVCGTLDI
ncbi:fragile X mental retardation [Perkinsus chesapeaki]|uniref:Fragile X mental retardation n=1 Tax=Perkinsus chesapeaki TaxID=330153 RepID=A0A7J6LRH7_PERCH|nr:fragile X mental retardation [Perkinsus chesapeaki]